MRIAVIPARGGSKRIPRKNIRLFAGKPVISYSIAAAFESGLFDRIIVSTDDEEIANVARAHGAEIPYLRPNQLADDFTGTNEVVKHALEWCQQHELPVKFACCIYATAPFVTVANLQNGYKALLESGKSFAFAVTTFPFPIQRAIRVTSDGGIAPTFPEFIDSRSQDLEEAFHDAGQFYWGRTEAFLNNVELFSTASVPVIIPRHLVQDIDTFEDWQRAEFMFYALERQDIKDR